MRRDRVEGMYSKIQERDNLKVGLKVELEPSDV